MPNQSVSRGQSDPGISGSLTTDAELNLREKRAAVTRLRQQMEAGEAMLDQDLAAIRSLLELATIKEDRALLADMMMEPEKAAQLRLEAAATIERAEYIAAISENPPPP